MGHVKVIVILFLFLLPALVIWVL